MVKKEKVIVYVDGPNLYRGMTRRWKDIKWLDLYAMCESFMKAHQELVGVKFFTSRIKDEPLKERRQNTYLEALVETGVFISEGYNAKGKTTCRECKCTWVTYKEKMTDIKMALNIVEDVHLYDMAMVISGDSDFLPSIERVCKNWNKRVVVVFPPNVRSDALKRAVKETFRIGRKKLKDHQLPDEITKKDGYILKKPDKWNMSLENSSLPDIGESNKQYTLN